MRGQRVATSGDLVVAMAGGGGSPGAPLGHGRTVHVVSALFTRVTSTKMIYVLFFQITKMIYVGLDVGGADSPRSTCSFRGDSPFDEIDILFQRDRFPNELGLSTESPIRIRPTTLHQLHHQGALS